MAFLFRVGGSWENNLANLIPCIDEKLVESEDTKDVA